jgi:hypothetical protein
MFSSRSVSRVYNEDQLPLRRWWQEQEVGVRSPSANEDVNPGTEEFLLLEGVTKQRRENRGWEH